MLYSIIGHDVANSTAQRQLTRPEHLVRIEKLASEGRLIIGGPNPIDHNKPELGMSGSLIIADFDSLQSVQEWCNEEPYLRDGVYSHVDIKPFLQVFPNS